MKLILENNYYRFIDYLIIFLPVALILGSPSVNIFLTVYSVLFLYLCYKKKFWSWLNILWIKVFFIYWIYIILLSFFSLDFESSFKTSLFFFRFLLFALCVGYFGFNYFSYFKIFKIWFYIISFVCVDIWIQYFFGVDLFGYPAHDWRYSGLFGDELVAGAFLWKISSPIIGLFVYELYFRKETKYNLSYLAYLLIPITILITGERTSFVMFTFCMLVSFIFFSFYFKQFKFFITSILIIIPILLFTYYFSNSVAHRYNELFSIINNFENSSYGVLFNSSLQVWEQNKLFGVGLKNFGLICDKYILIIQDIHPTCSNHPHNLYLQILSETGIIGLILFTSLFFLFGKRIFELIKTYDKKNINEYIFISCCCYILSFLWPLVTAGSFYTTWNGVFLWIVVAILINLTEKKFKSS